MKLKGLEFTRNQNVICGIDEAGRGSLLGPIIVAGVCVTKKSISEMVEKGIKDSKLLSPKKGKFFLAMSLILRNQYVFVE